MSSFNTLADRAKKIADRAKEGAINVASGAQDLKFKADKKTDALGKSLTKKAKWAHHDMKLGQAKAKEKVLGSISDAHKKKMADKAHHVKGIASGLAGKASKEIGKIGHAAGDGIEKGIGEATKVFPQICMAVTLGSGILGVIMGIMVVIYSGSNPSRDLNKSAMMLKMINGIWNVLMLLNLIIPLVLLIQSLVTSTIDQVESGACVGGGGGLEERLEAMIEPFAVEIGLAIHIINIIIFTAMNLYGNYKPTHVVDVLLWKLSLLILFLIVMTYLKSQEKSIEKNLEAKEKTSKIFHYLLRFFRVLQTIQKKLLNPYYILSLEGMIVVLIFIFSFFTSSAHHSHISLYKILTFLVYITWCIVVNIMVFFLPAPIPGILCQIVWKIYQVAEPKK